MANFEFRIPNKLRKFLRNAKTKTSFAIRDSLFGIVRRVAAGIAFACCVVPASATPDSAEPLPAPAAAERFSSVRTEYFSISAERAEAANHASTLVKEVEAYFVKTPRLWKKHLPLAGTRIAVELFSQPGVFKITHSPERKITLYASEAFFEKTHEDNMRKTLVRAMLEQMFPAEKLGESRVPAWLVRSVADETRIGSVPGRRIFLQKKSQKTPAVAPQKILSASAEALDSDDALRLNAVWFLRNCADVSPFLTHGKTDEEKLLAAFPHLFKDKENKFDAGTLEKFWATRLREIVARAPSGIDLPQESQRVFDDALLFLVEENGAENRVLGIDLVPARFDLKVRDLVSARLASFAENFRSVNPVWHNAFAEYGLFLEMFGNPDVEAETLTAQWHKAVFAREAAIALSREVRTLLDAAY